MAEQEGFLARGQGRLHYREVRPSGDSPRALVAVVHGLGEHSGRHQQLADFLVDRGYAVLLHDLRGHGRSFGLRGHVDRFEDYTDDLRALLDQVAFPGPVYVLGHSLGGLIAAAFAETFPGHLAGLILSSPCLQTAVPTPAWKERLAQGLSRITPRLRLASGLPLEKLAHDPQVAVAYRADPLCSRVVSARWYVELARKMAEVRERAGTLTVPTLVMQAGADELVNPGATRDFFAALGAQDKRLMVYAGAYHELFHDDCQEDAREEVAGWLDRHVAGRGANG